MSYVEAAKHYMPQAKEYLQTKAPARIRSRFQDYVAFGMEKLRRGIAQYPPLGAFLIVLLATSSVPLGMISLERLGNDTHVLGIFATISLTTLAIMLTIVGFIESGVVAVGGSVLAGVLAVCLGFTTLIVGSLTALWLGFRAIRCTWRSIQSLRSFSVPSMPHRPLTEEVKKTGQALKQAIVTPATSVSGGAGSTTTVTS